MSKMDIVCALLSSEKGRRTSRKFTSYVTIVSMRSWERMFQQMLKQTQGSQKPQNLLFPLRAIKISQFKLFAILYHFNSCSEDTTAFLTPAALINSSDIPSQKSIINSSKIPCQKTDSMKISQTSISDSNATMWAAS